MYNYCKLYIGRFKVSKFTGQKRKTQNNCSYLAININVCNVLQCRRYTYYNMHLYIIIYNS